MLALAAAGELNLPPPNMPLGPLYYLELKLFEKQPVPEGL